MSKEIKKPGFLYTPKYKEQSEYFKEKFQNLSIVIYVMFYNLHSVIKPMTS